MAETQDLLAPIEGPGVTVELQPRFHAASLRYFELDGAFAGIVRRVTGLNLPTSLGATHGTGAAEQSVTLLAWRSPSETTLLTTDAELLDALQTAAADKIRDLAVDAAAKADIAGLCGAIGVGADMDVAFFDAQGLQRLETVRREVKTRRERP